MSKAWVRAKEPQFVRDMVRDFCLIAGVLEREFQHYDRRGYVDFTVLKDLIGEETNKGLLWRLKDTAHHLFKNLKNGPRVGEFLDWSIGYIFHDAMKLKEDAYEQQNYAPWFEQLRGRDWPEGVGEVAEDLGGILGQTRESVAREITRIRYLLAHCRGLMPLYLAEYRDNELLARFFFSQRTLVDEVFGDDAEVLLARVYGPRLEDMYILAARSLRRGGWLWESAKAIHEAVRISPDSPEAARESELIEAGLA